MPKRCRDGRAGGPAARHRATDRDGIREHPAPGRTGVIRPTAWAVAIDGFTAKTPADAITDACSQVPFLRKLLEPLAERELEAARQLLAADNGGPPGSGPPAETGTETPTTRTTTRFVWPLAGGKWP